MAAVTSPHDYFTQTLPAQYAAALAAASSEVAGQPALTAVVTITGATGGVFSLRSAGDQLEALAGDQIADPDLRITTSYDDWHTAVAGDQSEAFIDYVLRNKVEVVQRLNGTVTIELTRSDGSLWQSTSSFGDHGEPTLTIMMTSDDYRAMLSGELNSQMAFLTGKLKFEGSLPLLMQMGALAS